MTRPLAWLASWALVLAAVVLLLLARLGLHCADGASWCERTANRLQRRAA